MSVNPSLRPKDLCHASASARATESIRPTGAGEEETSIVSEG
eukprot:gene2617-30932_t